MMAEGIILQEARLVASPTAAYSEVNRKRDCQPEVYPRQCELRWFLYRKVNQTSNKIARRIDKDRLKRSVAALQRREVTQQNCQKPDCRLTLIQWVSVCPL
jgi:hypothetical protein